jgi:hypothetical protein
MRSAAGEIGSVTRSAFVIGIRPLLGSLIGVRRSFSAVTRAERNERP